jgi:hypothetical protein
MCILAMFMFSTHDGKWEAHTAEQQLLHIFFFVSS